MLTKESLLLTKTKSIFEITLGVHVPYGIRRVRTVQMKVGDTVAAYPQLTRYEDLPEECLQEATGPMTLLGSYETQPSCFKLSADYIEGKYWYFVTLVSAPRESSTFIFRGQYIAE